MSRGSELRSILAGMAHWIAIHRWSLVYRVAVAVLLLAWLRLVIVAPAAWLARRLLKDRMSEVAERDRFVS